MDEKSQIHALDRTQPVFQLWFSELTEKKIRRGTHRTVRALQEDIRAWIAGWNDSPRPYVWVKTADTILASVAHYCQRISDSAQ